MKIIECPRDAMQGIEPFIPTDDKIRYINALLKVGFDTIDFGSFVSAKAIPQMQDTREVYAQLEWQTSSSKLLAIVANLRGASDALAFEGIRYLGFPMSISETFQQRNTNKSIEEGFKTLQAIQSECVSAQRELVVYISMAFGNPYGDPYAIEHVEDFVNRVTTYGPCIISLSDTIGVATPHDVTYLVEAMRQKFPSIELGVHLHASPAASGKNIDAAIHAGTQRIDGALRGLGGCPMANDALVGNIATETILAHLDKSGVKTSINRDAFLKSLAIADEIFAK
jgi:hydroxymethylglutaryl-CoA lyase